MQQRGSKSAAAGAQHAAAQDAPQLSMRMAAAKGSCCDTAQHVRAPPIASLGCHEYALPAGDRVPGATHAPVAATAQRPNALRRNSAYKQCWQP